VSDVLTKVCGKCKQEKPLEEFGKNAFGKHGRKSECKACVRIYWRKHNRKLGALAAPTREGCLNTESCRAVGPALCHPCATTKLHATKEWQDARAATIEHRAAMKRLAAEGAAWLAEQSRAQSAHPSPTEPDSA